MRVRSIELGDTVGSVQIRSATLSDAAALVTLWQCAGLKFDVDDVPDELAGVLSRDPELVLIAEDDHGSVGAVLGTFDGRRGSVNRLAAHPDRQGLGTGSALLAELERRLRAKGCRKVNLAVEPDNATVTRFYARHGYGTDELIFMEKWLGGR